MPTCFSTPRAHFSFQKNCVFGLAAACTLLFAACQNDTCHDLSGRWSNKEGQTLIFEKGDQALWLIQFGSQTDSFAVRYRYDCKIRPAQLDLSGFKSGPLAGKTLFGIIEWSNDSTFRFDAEPGAETDAEARPKEFNGEQTMIFSKL